MGFRDDESRAFLDFYGVTASLPVRLNSGGSNSNDGSFGANRDYLLRSLGIAPAVIEGKSVLEVGPGTGQKARMLINRFGPASYTCVDAHPLSIESTRKQLTHVEKHTDVRIVETDFLEWESDDVFDVVIAEGVVPLQGQGKNMVQSLCRRTRPGGVLIITTFDPITQLPELLRRHLARRLGLIDSDATESAARVARFFSADLNYLRGMNRRREDWAMDAVVQPWSVDSWFSVVDAIDTSRPFADFLGSSPVFMTDLRWYKDPSVLVESRMSIARQNYLDCRLSMLDSRSGLVLFPSKNIESLCIDIWRRHQSVVADDAKIIESRVEQLIRSLPDEMAETKKSLESWLVFLENGVSDALGPFRPFWGRGQQYVSFVRLCE